MTKFVGNINKEQHDSISKFLLKRFSVCVINSRTEFLKENKGLEREVEVTHPIQFMCNEVKNVNSNKMIVYTDI